MHLRTPLMLNSLQTSSEVSGTSTPGREKAHAALAVFYHLFHAISYPQLEVDIPLILGHAFQRMTQW